MRRELKLLGLENFHNGNPENLNPELGIDDQADLLPYNKKFEFPIEHLKIGMYQLLLSIKTLYVTYYFAIN